MKRKSLIISWVIVGILVVAIIACGVEIYNKNKRIENLEKAQIQNTIQTNNENNNGDILNALGQKLFGQDFDNLSVSINPDGKNEKMDLKYKLAGKDQKEVTLNNIELAKENNKWIVSKDSKLTKEQTELVEKIANNENKVGTEIRNNIAKQMQAENKVMQQIQNNMNKQINEMNNQINSLFNN